MWLGGEGFTSEAKESTIRGGAEFVAVNKSGDRRGGSGIGWKADAELTQNGGCISLCRGCSSV